jgi:rRNA biogenesis protein RRP5
VKGLKPRQAKAWFRRWAKWEEERGDGKSRERVLAKAQEWARVAGKGVAKGGVEEGEDEE